MRVLRDLQSAHTDSMFCINNKLLKTLKNNHQSKNHKENQGLHPCVSRQRKLLNTSSDDIMVVHFKKSNK